jgi:type I restriction enzyme M protein
LSAIITTAEAARNDYNLSPSRYVSVERRGTPVLPAGRGGGLLEEAEEERAEADKALWDTITGVTCVRLLLNQKLQTSYFYFTH